MRCVCYRYRKNILIPIHVLRLWFVVTQASGVERWGTVWGASPPPLFSLVGTPQEMSLHLFACERPDFKPIFNRLFPKCVCLQASAPDPVGGAYSVPPDPQREKFGSHTDPSVS